MSKQPAMRSADHRPVSPARASLFIAVAMFIAALVVRPGLAQTSSAFTYQAMLRANGELVDGSADLRFRLYDAPAGGNQVGVELSLTNVNVTGGLVTVPLDFGTDPIADGSRWIEIDVRSPAGGGSYVTLAPRQALAAAPLAIQTRGVAVDTAGDAGLGTTAPEARLDVVAPADLNIREGLIRIGVSDSPNDYLQICNATQHDGQFMPLLWGHHETDARETFQILGSTTPGQDAGAQALLSFEAWRSDGDALTEPIATRPVFTWHNGLELLMALDASGRLGIGTDSPAAALHVADVSPLIALTDSDSTGAAQEGWISFRDDTGTERGWVGYGSSGNTDLQLVKRNPGGDINIAAHGAGEVRVFNAPLAISQQTPTVLTLGSWQFGQRGSGSGADLMLHGTLNVRTGGAVRFTNQSGATRVKIDTDTEGQPLVRLYGASSLNVIAGAYDGPNGWGQVAVCDASSNIQAEMTLYGGAGNTVTLNADTIIADVKNFRVPNPRDPKTEIVYACVEGPEAGAYVRGTAQLVDGRAVVELPDYLADVAVSEGMTVHVTPLSAESKGLAVVSRSVERFEVGELFGGTGTYAFDWRVTAVRRGFKDYQVLRPQLMAGDAP
jgi:hypothetical protein